MMGGIFRKEAGWIGGVALALAGFVGLNAALSGVTGARLDLTQDRLFTLSEGSVQTLESLTEPVEITLYYSRQLGQEVPFYGNYADRVRDLLSELDAVGGANLTVTELDPLPFSTDEDDAVEAGLQGVPLDQGGDTVYFGLAASLGERSASIAFLQPERERFLEYDLIRLIGGLANPEKPKLGIITNKEVFGSVLGFQQGQPPVPWILTNQLQETFSTTQLWSARDLEREQPDLLLLIHPHGLDDEFVYAIDQYMLRGGRAVIFADAFNETDVGTPPGPMTMPGAPRSSIDPLLSAWGVTLSEGEVAGDRTLGRMVNAGSQSQVVPAPYVLWVQPGPEQMNSNDPVVADLPQLIMPSPGFLTPVEGGALSFTPLIETTADAMAISTEGLDDPQILELVANFQPKGEPFVLAARLSGEAQSAFPDGRPVEPEPDAAATEGEEAGETTDGAEAPAEESETTTEDTAAPAEDAAPEEEPAQPHLARSEAPMTIILVADADMLEDRFWVQVQNFFGQRVAQPFSGNGALAVNAVEALAGSEALLSLRTRGQGQRPFTVIETLQREAEARYRGEEQQLREKLEETEARLQEMQAQEGAAEAQEEALQRFTDELLATRQQLRDVTFELRKDIEALETRITLINVAAVPAGVAILAMLLGLARLRRRSRAA